MKSIITIITAIVAISILLVGYYVIFGTLSIADASIIITAIATLVIAFQVLLFLKQIRADHERARREKAIELMQFWTAQINAKSLVYVYIRDFVEQLGEKQCLSLYHSKTFVVDKKLGELLVIGLKDQISEEEMAKTNEDGELIITEMLSNVVRKIITSYLNLLETVATAWRHSVADREILEEEFHSVILTRANTFRLEQYRNVTGIYPSIKVFEQYLQRKQQNYRISKPPLAKGL